MHPPGRRNSPGLGQRELRAGRRHPRPVTIVLALALVLAVQFALSREPGPERIARLTPDVGCRIEVAGLAPGPAQAFPTATRTAALGCGAAAIAVDYARFKDERAAREAVRTRAPRDAYCLAGREVVVGHQIQEAQFRVLCGGLSGSLHVPAGYAFFARY